MTQKCHFPVSGTLLLKFRFSAEFFSLFPVSRHFFGAFPPLRHKYNAPSSIRALEHQIGIIIGISHKKDGYLKVKCQMGMWDIIGQTRNIEIDLLSSLKSGY